MGNFKPQFKMSNYRDFVHGIVEEGTSIDEYFSNASTLRHEQHLEYRDRVLETVRPVLSGVSDLKKAGLVYNAGDLGTTVTYYERMGDMTDATVSMDPVTPVQKDRVTFDEVGMPMPLFQCDFQSTMRHDLAQKKKSIPTVTRQIGLCAKIVAEKIEDSLFNGIKNFQFDGKKVYGYTTYPGRESISLTGDGWSNPDNSNIVKDTKAMLKRAYSNKRRGPFVLYVARNVWAEIQDDYSANKDRRTYKERIMAFDEIIDVKSSYFLPNDDVILVEMTQETVEMAMCQDIRTVDWAENPFATNYKIFGAMVPVIKQDRNGSCGIVHASKTTN